MQLGDILDDVTLDVATGGLEITHVHHAGNSSGVVDGAAALLITSPEYATAHGMTPRARIESHSAGDSSSMHASSTPSSPV